MSSFDIVSSGKPSAVQSETEANSAAGSDNGVNSAAPSENGVNSAAPSENEVVAPNENEDGVADEVGDDGATLVADAVDGVNEEIEISEKLEQVRRFR